jgi:hypothetical protein
VFLTKRFIINTTVQNATMPSFLDQIQAIDNMIARPTPPQTEPRSMRRKKARDAKRAIASSNISVVK